MRPHYRLRVQKPRSLGYFVYWIELDGTRISLLCTEPLTACKQVARVHV